MTALLNSDSLVVRCPNWVGDIVMATPVYECLRENFPNTTITACVRPYARGILEDSPWFDHIVDCQDRSLAGIRNIRKELQHINPDAGILLTNTSHSYFTFRVAGVSRIYGYRRNLRKHFLTDGPELQRDGNTYRPMPMQAYYLDLCRYLGLKVPENPKPRLHISDLLAGRGADQLKTFGIDTKDTVIGLNPGASFGSSKCWPPEYFARLAEMLQENHACKLLLLVGPGEEEIAAKIVADSNAEIINTAANRIDLAMLKPLVKRCDLFITNDTGPRHYAVAFDVPNLVLMGPTNPIYTATNLEHTRVLQRGLPCIPCHKKTCPLGHHACMREITPELVAREAGTMLGASH